MQIVRIYQLKETVRIEAKQEKISQVQVCLQEPQFKYNDIHRFSVKSWSKRITYGQWKARLNVLISDKIDFGIKKSIIKRKSQGPNGFTGELQHIFNRLNIKSSLSVPENRREYSPVRLTDT